MCSISICCVVQPEQQPSINLPHTQIVQLIPNYLNTDFLFFFFFVDEHVCVYVCVYE